MSASLRFARGSLLDADGAPSAWPRLAVIGDPIAHSLSPTLHAAALRHHRLDDRYERIEVPADELPSFLDAALRAGMRGLNLTRPHKLAPLALGLRCAEEVGTIGAANTLVRRGEAWVAHNSDARGFALALSRWRGRLLGATLRDVVLIGSGGAARAVHAALVDLGARRLRVAARDPARAAWASAHCALEGLEFRTASLVVQCSSLGWNADDPSPVDAAQWSAATAAFELGYASTPSRFLRDAAAASAPTCDGLPMLVAQAALAFTMWYGGASPLEPMASSVGLQW